LVSLQLLFSALQKIPYLARVLRYRPAPTSKASMHIDSSAPLVKVAPFHLVLLSVPPLGLQNEHVAIYQTNQEIRPVLAHHAPIDIEYLETQVVVLNPCGYGVAVVKNEGIRRLPGAVIDANVDV